MADGGGGSSPLVVVLAAVIAGAASYGAAYLTFASKDQELKVHLVEIAISILRADPKEDVTPARGWALDIIEKNSAVLFSKEDREALLHKPLMELSRAEVDHILSETQRAIEGAGGSPSPDVVQRTLKAIGGGSFPPSVQEISPNAPKIAPHR